MICQGIVTRMITEGMRAIHEKQVQLLLGRLASQARGPSILILAFPRRKHAEGVPPKALRGSAGKRLGRRGPEKDLSRL